jgi:hypothetical protein
MLKERYIFGSNCQFGCDTWLAPEGMLTWMTHQEVQKYHSSLKQHWTNSAPMLFPQSKLSLFGITEDVPDSLIYLVWSAKDSEPEVWT